MVWIGLGRADTNLASTYLLGELSHSVFAGPHHRTWHKTPQKAVSYGSGAEACFSISPFSCSNTDEEDTVVISIEWMAQHFHLE